MPVAIGELALMSIAQNKPDLQFHSDKGLLRPRTKAQSELAVLREELVKTTALLDSAVVFRLLEVRVVEVNYLQMVSVQHPRGLHVLREMCFGAHKEASSLSPCRQHCSLLLRKVRLCGVIRTAFGGLLCKWALWPGILIPATCDHRPRPLRSHHQGFHQPTSNSVATIPSSVSFMATHNYYQHHLDSTSSNRSAEYPGDAIPHHPGLPKANLGHWWAGFFFGKSTLLFMATVLESLKHLESPQASSGTVTCDLALEAMKKQPHGQPGKANTGPPS
ncbi:LOW QUALITY PROTEIN: uncharacterized protein LOC124525007 [Lynx rufus]|uniref:LOW QUALITY PROTEIN: uncharacterized protein LOC124525007 n=1 Tax=Lynx rufus TaxID=61384 RepID=UPI001F1249F7|nr:LOW QUALITY PROTEIN: uncharacterized protein LOC124525007 [Lynx rufus]